eukprot:9393593-Lingulodinium_polyedra.AAC.1
MKNPARGCPGNSHHACNRLPPRPVVLVKDLRGHTQRCNDHTGGLRGCGAQPGMDRCKNGERTGRNRQQPAICGAS